MILLGNLSNADLKICTSDFFMSNKRIRGFNLVYYLRDEVSEERRRQIYKIVEDDINAGGEYFGAKIAKEFKLEDYSQALDQVEQLQDEGKVLLSIS